MKLTLGVADGIEVVATADGPGQAEVVARAHQPHVAVVDVRMPGGGGARATRSILEVSPHTRVIANSVQHDRAAVVSMLRAGAVGYATKGIPAPELAEMIRDIAAGGRRLSPRAADAAVEELVAHLDQDEQVRAERRGIAERIRRVIEQGGLTLVVQPILDLTNDRVVGYEALSRFSDERSPLAWFQEAAAVGLGEELELTAVRAALARFGSLPPEAFLTLNLSPAAARSRRLAGLLPAGVASRVVIEVTEHAPVESYAAFCEAIAPLRERGLRLAIDDLGSGFANLQHLLELRPDVVKLDTSLVRDVDSAPDKRALTAAVVSFAEHSGADVIAEGIETDAELAALRDLGVVYGQGYLLGRPRPLR